MIQFAVHPATLPVVLSAVVVLGLVAPGILIHVAWKGRAQ